MEPIIILGAGYTGRHLYTLAKAKGMPVLASSREPVLHLTYAEPADRMQFDLARRDTWRNIPSIAHLIWCFPAAPLVHVEAFAQTLTAPRRRIVVFGSTSAYDLSNQSDVYPPSWLDELASIDLNKPRIQGEEYLRHQEGAIVLRVAGIYGPGRNPLDWITQGRVRPSRKYVNMIHVEDLAEICLLALERGIPGEIYNVSDGTPRTWKEICATAQERWGVTALPVKENRPSGKRISNAKLRTELGYEFRHPDLYGAIDLIESQSIDSQEGFSRRSSNKAAREN